MISTVPLGLRVNVEDWIIMSVKIGQFVHNYVVRCRVISGIGVYCTHTYRVYTQLAASLQVQF